MKQIKLFAAILLAAIGMSSCTTYSYTSRSTGAHRQDINGTALIVDVRPDFSKRIATESKRCKTIVEAREEAKYLAITNNKCDVIVDPVYKFERIGLRYKAYLTGFAGYYQNPRTMYEDIQLLQNINKEDIEKYLMLKDPSVIGLLNQVGNSEVINIFDGMPAPKECCHQPEPAPKDEAAPAKKKK